ncbi:MAG: hypothetical protein QOE90_1588 [Thermoplasmata archaeon]|jgi:hypothetical protein|nr:hypothetical protein [Thermoplasmata archaeon]
MHLGPDGHCHGSFQFGVYEGTRGVNTDVKVKGVPGTCLMRIIFVSWAPSGNPADVDIGPSAAFAATGMAPTPPDVAGMGSAGGLPPVGPAAPKSDPVDTEADHRCGQNPYPSPPPPTFTFAGHMAESTSNPGSADEDGETAGQMQGDSGVTETHSWRYSNGTFSYYRPYPPPCAAQGETYAKTECNGGPCWQSDDLIMSCAWVGVHVWSTGTATGADYVDFGVHDDDVTIWSDSHGRSGAICDTSGDTRFDDGHHTTYGCTQSDTTSSAEFGQAMDALLGVYGAL